MLEVINQYWLNISQFLLIIVGLSAVGIYIVQERAKIKDAASLIILQIDELQIRIQEVQSYITDQGLNSTAFYESLPLMDTNYWSKYKHLFIRKLDNKSYTNFNKFYQYVSCIQEQQELLRNLQRNYFFVKQTAISNCEFTYICETLKEVDNSIITQEQLKSLLDSIPTGEGTGENQQIVSNMVLQLQQKNPNIDVERFWTIYNGKRQRLIGITNQDSLTTYTPMQISTTLQAVLKQIPLLEIAGISGYDKLRKLAKIEKK